MNEAIAALDRIPLFEGVDRGAITTERLGGLTNRNYKITSPAGTYVPRPLAHLEQGRISEEVNVHDRRNDQAGPPERLRNVLDLAVLAGGEHKTAAQEWPDREP